MSAPAPEPRRAAGTLGRTLRVLLGVAAALAGLALLAHRAREAYQDAGGTWQIASDASDAVIDAVTKEGIAYPERDLDDPLLASRTIVVTEGMNERTAKTVVRKLLYLNAQDPKRPIELYLATQGGWFDAAFAIIGTMHAIAAPVDVTAIGGCHSAGAIVLASATGRRRAVDDALISVHADIEEDEGEFASATRERARIDAVYRERAHLPREWFPLEADHTYFLTAREALGYGLIDEIVARPALTAEGTKP